MGTCRKWNQFKSPRRPIEVIKMRKTNSFCKRHGESCHCPRPCQAKSSSRLQTTLANERQHLNLNTHTHTYTHEYTRWQVVDALNPARWELLYDKPKDSRVKWPFDLFAPFRFRTTAVLARIGPTGNKFSTVLCARQSPTLDHHACHAHFYTYRGVFTKLVPGQRLAKCLPKCGHPTRLIAVYLSSAVWP